ncbi:MAG: hypothetical protein HY907_06100 [Deltaproteobacteria bacterium]|nr:hypothetical protein [Deltaproteobacteria bacterium]
MNHRTTSSPHHRSTALPHHLPTDGHRWGRTIRAAAAAFGLCIAVGLPAFSCKGQSGSPRQAGSPSPPTRDAPAASPAESPAAALDAAAPELPDAATPPPATEASGDGPDADPADAAPPPPPVAVLADLSGPGSCAERFHRDAIPAATARQVVLNELHLMSMALDALEAKAWNGAWGDPLPLRAGDFEAREVHRMVADEERKGRDLTVPAEWEPVYVSEEAAAQVQAEILRARGEYVAFLRDRGVREEYLAELDRVLPGTAERMKYFADNDPDADPTATEPLVLDESTMEQDYSRLVLGVHGADVWNGSELCRNAKLLGPEPDEAEALREWHRGCRDVSLRQTVYHELTHALQKAYVNLHLPPASRDSRANWIDAVRTLSDVERSMFWRWGGHEALAGVANYHLAQERQADGLSYQVLVAACGLSQTQASTAWEHWFGRLSDARDLLLRLRDRFDRQWPDYPPDDFGDALVQAFEPDGWAGDVGGLRSLALKLSALPAYAGYLQPMRPEDSGGFWAALREPPPS